MKVMIDIPDNAQSVSIKTVYGDSYGVMTEVKQMSRYELEHSEEIERQRMLFSGIGAYDA